MMRIFDLLGRPQFTQFKKKHGQTDHMSEVASKKKQTHRRQAETDSERERMLQISDKATKKQKRAQNL